MRAGVFALMFMVAAGLVFAADNSSTAPDVVIKPADAKKGAPLVLPEFVPQRPDQVPPGYQVGSEVMPKTADGKYYINGQAVESRKREVIRRDLSKDIAIHEVNIRSVSTDFCTGLDSVTHLGNPCIQCAHPMNDTLYFFDQDTLSLEDTMALNPGNTNCFGTFVWSGLWFSDWGNSNIYFTANLGSTWDTYTNPAGDDGRGMDGDYTYSSLIWEAHSDVGGDVYSLVAFPRHSSTGTWYDVSSYIPGQISGLTAFDLEGQLGLAVTVYNTPEIFFFKYTGSGVVFLGSRDLPWSAYCAWSGGIAYSWSNGLFYWAFDATTGSGWISILDIDLRALFQDGFEHGHTADWSCAGQCYGGYTFDCNPNKPCVCFTSTEGYGVCTAGGPCDPALACNSSDDCDPGYVCLTCTNCGYDICAIRQCEFAIDAPLPEGDGSGLTMSGR